MKMYVVVRDDLTVSQKAVQAGHALAACLLCKSNTWCNTTLIYLKVENEKKLIELVDKLEVFDYSYKMFREPDLNHSITAIASTEGKKLFSKLKLL